MLSDRIFDTEILLTLSPFKGDRDIKRIFKEMRQDTSVTPIFIQSKSRNYLGNTDNIPPNVKRLYSSPASIPYNRSYHPNLIPKPVVRANSEHAIAFTRGF